MCSSNESCNFYRPQRSYEGYVFTPVCHSVHRGGVCLSAWWDTIPGTRHPHVPGTPQDQAPPQGQGTPPGPGIPTHRGTDGYCCGLYASHWNAFLFSIVLHRICFHKIIIFPLKDSRSSIRLYSFNKTLILLYLTQ